MTHKPPCRRGFTLIELMVVSMAMCVLTLIVSSAWYGVGRSAADLAARSQLLQEIDMAGAMLSRDLGGSLASSDGRLGDKKQARLVGIRAVGGQLQLCYDGGSPPNGQPDWGSPDTVVTYQMSGDPTSADRLIRTDAGTSFTVARNVSNMTLTTNTETNGLNYIYIALTFTFHSHDLRLPDLTHTCTFKARLP